MCYLFVSRHGSVQMSSHFFFPKQRRCHTQMRHFFVSCDRVYACICATHSPACMSVCQRLTCINVFSHVFDFLTHKYVCLRARYARIYIHIYMNTYSYIWIYIFFLSCFTCTHVPRNVYICPFLGVLSACHRLTCMCFLTSCVSSQLYLSACQDSCV